MLFKIDETNKSSASKVAKCNLFLMILLTVLLSAFAFLLFESSGEEIAESVGRMISVEVALNILFFPFTILLIVGIENDKYKWITSWIKATLVQLTYIFLLNLLIQIYVTVNLNVGNGLVVLMYTMIITVFIIQIIIYMNKYRNYKSREDENQNQIQEFERQIRAFVIEL